MSKKAAPKKKPAAKKAENHVTSAAGIDPKSWPKELRNGAAVLKHTHDASVGFVQEYFNSRARGGGGTTSDREQDQLRAALVFAAAGLDSLLKHLIREAIPPLADKHEDIADHLIEFAQSRIGREEGRKADIGPGFVARALISGQPKNYVIEAYVYELTGSSLQSADQLYKTADAFGIDDSNMKTHIRKIAPVFQVRNRIIHEMDIDFSKPNRSRNTRKQEQSIKQVNDLLDFGNSVLYAVNERLV